MKCMNCIHDKKCSFQNISLEEKGLYALTTFVNKIMNYTSFLFDAGAICVRREEK